MSLIFEDFLEMEKSVQGFNNIMGNDYFSKELTSLYKSLTLEELDELLEASIINDRVEILDAICDLIFTGFIWLNTTGVEVKELYQKIRFSELRQLHGGGKLKKLVGAFEQDRPDLFVRYLIEMMILKQVHYDFKGAFQEVLRSNMSKFSEKGIDIQKEISIIEEDGRYGGVFIEEVSHDGKIYVMFKAMKDLSKGVDFDKPKLIKSSSYSEPVLEEFVL
ncbi:NTP pyrophosphohydrolase-like domain [Vibrio phage 1.170.O._10N.261.52.C3]|nr:NTP pyrophosphohydrolase-like domain [Vibrio phage 1.170.O._10N.261.52.C3]